MTMKNEVKHTAHSSYRCEYHLVFAPKYRRKVIDRVVSFGHSARKRVVAAASRQAPIWEEQRKGRGACVGGIAGSLPHVERAQRADNPTQR